MPLHIDYRPISFDEFVGNEATIKGIRTMLAKKDKPHAVLLSGPSGCGKTTLARLIGSELGCNDLEYHELNAANTRGIDTIREIIQLSNFHPLIGEIKVYILDEAHGITGAASDALLKFLEDTPEHVYVILCTTAPEKLTATIRGRCQAFTVAALKDPELKKILRWIIGKEKLVIDEEVLNTIVGASEGCARKAVVYLDQVMNIQDKAQQLSIIYGSMLDSATTMELCQKLMVPGKGLGKWREVGPVIDAMDTEPEGVRRAVLGYFQSALLERTKDKEGKPRFPIKTQAEADRLYQIMTCFEQSFFYSGKPGLILACYKACQI